MTMLLMTMAASVISAQASSSSAIVAWRAASRIADRRGGEHLGQRGDLGGRQRPGHRGLDPLAATANAARRPSSVVVLSAR